MVSFYDNLRDLNKQEKEYLSEMLGYDLKEQDWMPDFASGIPKVQLNYLNSLLIKDTYKIIIDIGCFIGGFTKIMATHAKKNNGMVYSVDLFETSESALHGIHKNHDIKSMYLRNMYERGLINYVNVQKKVSWDFAKEFEDKSVDFVFIDADHRYESVKKDIVAWIPKIRPGGIIAGHDYDFEDYDEKYINEDGHGDRHHGVIKAVNEILGIPNYFPFIPIWHKEIK